LAWLTSTDELSEQGRWIIDRHLEALTRLDEDIRRVEGRLESMTQEDSMVIELRKRPGLGPVTSWTIRAEIGRFDRFRSGKQLARFCGLSPRNASSGARQADAGLIKAASAQLRAVLIQVAHLLRRHDPHWRAFAARLQGDGKPYCLVVAAVANRWIRGLFHQMKITA
jgi:transposase